MEPIENLLGRVERRGAVWLAGIALAVAAAMTLLLTWKLTFYQDTFDYLMNRRDPTLDALFLPHNEHISIIPVAIEEVILRLFGMGTARPEYVLLAAFIAAAAWLLFVYIRQRLGDWAALFAVVLILCLGPAWEVLLWPFEIGFIGSIAFGVAMFLALEREDRRWDAAACVFLAISMAFSSLGIPFAAGAVVDVVQKRRRLGWRRAYLAAIPIVLFAIWYLHWGSRAEGHITLQNIMSSPRFVLESLAVDLGSMVGLGTNPVGGSTDPVWGRILLPIVIAALAYRKWRRPDWSPELWPVAVAAATNWFLTAFNQIPGRDPTSSRYQYAGAFFIVLVLANLLRGERLSRRGILIGAAITLLAIGPNLVVLHDADTGLKQQTVFTKADLAALGIARKTVPEDFQLTPEVAGTPSLVNVYAGQYFEAVDEYGTPAYSPEELIGAPPEGRRQSDVILGQALPIKSTTRTETFQRHAPSANCQTIPPEDAQEVQLQDGLTRIEVAPGPEAHLSMRRFATGEYPVALPTAPGESTTALRIPADESTQPWFLFVEADQPVRVCS